MFGRKTREITRLKDELAAYEESAPLLPLAKEIGQRAAQAMRIVEGEAGANMEAVLDAVMADLTHEQRQSLLLERFKQLPVGEQLAMLARHFTDEQTQQALKEESSRLIEHDAFARSIKLMRAECKDQARVDLGSVPVHSCLHVELYQASNFEDKSPWELKENGPERALTATSLGEGRFRVIKDYISPMIAVNSRLVAQAVEVNSTIRLGAALPSDDDRYYAYYRSPLQFSNEEGNIMALNCNFTELALGYIGVDNHDVMSGANLPWEVFPEDKRPGPFTTFLR